MTMLSADKTENELFRSAVLKTVWAVENTHRFEVELQTALDNAQTDPPFTTRQEYHSEFRGFSIKIATIRPVPAMWGLTLGDIVNTFYSAFDNLAWALVCRGKTPPSTLSEAQQRGVYFPICSSNALFNKSIPRYLPGVKRGDIAKVRRAQPYAIGEKVVARHCLTTLQKLSNADKHRSIQPVWLRPDANWHQVVNARDCLVGRIRDMRPNTLKVDIELARVYAKKTGLDPDIALQGYVATSVTIDDELWLPNFMKTLREFAIQTMLGFVDGEYVISLIKAEGLSTEEI
jgi:hypothetical protein